MILLNHIRKHCAKALGPFGHHQIGVGQFEAGDES